MAFNLIKSLLSKSKQLVWKFRKTILLVLIVVIATSAGTALMINESRNPYVVPTPTPTPTPNNTAVPTFSPTANPTSTPRPTPTPQPTYIPGEKQYFSYGKVYVTGAEVYGGDLDGTQLPWGVVYLGDSKSVSFYVRSDSNVPITLSLSITDWMPSGISSYLNVSWNYNQTVIQPNQEIFLTLTLTTPLSQDFANYLISNNVNSFNFNIHIYSTKY